MLSARQVSFRYPQEGYGLLPTTLEISPGKMTLVTGPSGCGKGTLARCLMGLIPHLYHGEFSGEVWLNGYRISETHLWQLAEKAGMVFQNPAARHFRFGALYLAELKMLLKWRGWWWYLVSLGLVIAQVAVPQGTTAFLLAAAWLWMILLLSASGSREALHNTSEIVFSAPRPTLNQLPPAWLAAFTVTALMGSGAFLRYLLDGEAARFLAWASGALFIPSLALALGVLTSSRKPFEVIYVAWMYLILNAVPPLDFVGVTPESPWRFYSLSACALLALAVFVRHWRLMGGKLAR